MPGIKVATLLGLAIAYAALLLRSTAAEPVETKSALETDAAGWTDLLPDKDLKNWKRVPIPAGSKLNERNPWSVDDKNKLLICDAEKIHEMLLYDKELAGSLRGFGRPRRGAR